MVESRSFSKPIRLTASRNNLPYCGNSLIRNHSCSILLKIYRMIERKGIHNLQNRRYILIKRREKVLSSHSKEVICFVKNIFINIENVNFLTHVCANFFFISTIQVINSFYLSSCIFSSILWEEQYFTYFMQFCTRFQSDASGHFA